MWGLWRWSEEWAAINCLKLRRYCGICWTGGQRSLNDDKIDGRSTVHQIHHDNSLGKKEGLHRIHSTQSSFDGWAYSTVIVKHFLVNPSMVEIGQLLYSPDLIPADVFYLWKWKLKRNSVQDIEGMKITILNMVALDASIDCFVQLLERYKKSAAVKGDHSEGK